MFIQLRLEQNGGCRLVKYGHLLCFRSGIPEASLGVVGRSCENDAVASILRDGSCWRGRHNGHRFSVGRWVTGDTVDAMLENGASGAVVSALAPICDKLQRQADVTTNLIELKKINSWQPVSKMAAGQRRPSDCA
jgi:hypothetical protein